MRSWVVRWVMSSPKNRMWPLVGGKSPGDGVEQGGLPGSIGPQNGTPFPRSNPYGHIRNCFQGTEGPPNAQKFQGEGSSNGV